MPSTQVILIIAVVVMFIIIIWLISQLKRKDQGQS